ncbi:MAG: response regulator [Candidatus Desulfofervidus auxilii]|nr:response regulator [Candidatus Desulfofervidus auxilii]
MLRILLVEDDKDVAEVISQFLYMLGYFVDIAFSAEMALKLFNKNQYNLIITDGNLPGKDGLWLIQKIKKDSPFLPILGISGYGEIQIFLSAGADAFLSKPFTFQQLKEKIDFLLKDNLT